MTNQCLKKKQNTKKKHLGTWQKSPHVAYLLTKKTTFSKPNLCVHKKETLKELASQDDLIIHEVDKGGAMVMQDMDRKLYMKPRMTYNTKINNVVDNFRKQNLLTEKAAIY